MSVIIPTHDRRDLLALSLRTALWQRDVDLEVIVVDDGSTDGTAEAVAALGDPRVRLVRHDTPQGVSAARNRGIDEARGEWVAFLDDDDLWAPHKLALQLEAARESGRSWAYAGAVFVDLRQRVQGGAPPLPPDRMVEFLPRWDPMPGGCSNAIVRRTVLDASGPFDPQFGTLADWDLLLRVLRVGGAPACIPEPLVAYRLHGSNMSLDTEQTLRELDLYEGRHATSVDRPRFYRHVARVAMRSGRRRKSIQLLVRAALLDGRDRRLTAVLDDATFLLGRAQGSFRRRLRLGPSRRAHERALRRDRHREWKDRAQAWLDQLPTT